MTANLIECRGLKLNLKMAVQGGFSKVKGVRAGRVGGGGGGGARAALRLAHCWVTYRLKVMEWEVVEHF